VTCAERLPGRGHFWASCRFGGTKGEAIRRKSFKARETTSLLCPPEQLVQTHKIIKAMICALQRV
jgi:hypothetical protein